VLNLWSEQKKPGILSTIEQNARLSRFLNRRRQRRLVQRHGDFVGGGGKNDHARPDLLYPPSIDLISDPNPARSDWSVAVPARTIWRGASPPVSAAGELASVGDAFSGGLRSGENNGRSTIALNSSGGGRVKVDSGD
jgi:hypothetical protein